MMKVPPIAIVCLVLCLFGMIYGVPGETKGILVSRTEMILRTERVLDQITSDKTGETEEQIKEMAELLEELKNNDYNKRDTKMVVRKHISWMKNQLITISSDVDLSLDEKMDLSDLWELYDTLWNTYETETRGLSHHTPRAAEIEDHAADPSSRTTGQVRTVLLVAMLPLLTVLIISVITFKSVKDQYQKIRRMISLEAEPPSSEPPPAPGPSPRLEILHLGPSASSSPEPASYENHIITKDITRLGHINRKIVSSERQAAGMTLGPIPAGLGKLRMSFIEEDADDDVYNDSEASHHYEMTNLVISPKPHKSEGDDAECYSQLQRTFQIKKQTTIPDHFYEDVDFLPYNSGDTYSEVPADEGGYNVLTRSTSHNSYYSNQIILPPIATIPETQHLPDIDVDQTAQHDTGVEPESLYSTH